MTKYNKEAGLKILLWGLNLIDPTGDSSKLYRERINEMSDEEYAKWIDAVDKKQDFVSVLYTNLSKSPITTKNNLAIAPKMGVRFFQKLEMTDKNTGVRFVTNETYLVMWGRFRKQIQMITDKMSVADNNKVLDDLTDQPTGDSKGSGNSYPELLVSVAQGHNKSIVELMKYRGGDKRGFDAMNRMLMETGTCNLAALTPVEGRAKSTVTVSTFLKAMHLNNAL